MNKEFYDSLDNVLEFLDKYDVVENTGEHFYLLEQASKLNEDLKDEIINLENLINRITNPTGLNYDVVDTIVENNFPNLHYIFSWDFNSLAVFDYDEFIFFFILDDFNKDVREFYNKFIDNDLEIKEKLIDNYCKTDCEFYIDKENKAVFYYEC